MIKAVFFDLYHTLIGYKPPREIIMAEALNDFGIEITPDRLIHPIIAADEFIYYEHSRSPIGKRSEEDKKALWGQYQSIALREAGIEPTGELIGYILGKMSRIKFDPVLFDDVLSTLNTLKDRGLLLGLISNVDKDVTELLTNLGLVPLLQVVVTSLDSGYNKPQPEIFREAARQGGVQPEESIYVGDQYQIDVIGAGKAGMLGILIDRGNHYNEDIKEPKIQNLQQLYDHLS